MRKRIHQRFGQALFTQPRQAPAQPHDECLGRARIGHAFAFGTGAQPFPCARFAAFA